MKMPKAARTAILIGVLLIAMSCTTSSPTYRMFGKHARMREIAGDVITTGTTSWGDRYIVVQDQSTGLRVFVLSDSEACVPRKPFKGMGHLGQRVEDEKDYDATFHFHLTDRDKVCG